MAREREGDSGRARSAKGARCRDQISFPFPFERLPRRLYPASHADVVSARHAILPNVGKEPTKGTDHLTFEGGGSYGGFQKKMYSQDTATFAKKKVS